MNPSNPNNPAPDQPEPNPPEPNPDAEDLGIYDLVDDEPAAPLPPPHPMASPSARLHQPIPTGTGPAAASVRCPKCKYDLRGSRPGRCPECGTTISQSSLQRSAMQPKLWRDVYMEPTLWLIGGLLVGCTMFSLDVGPSGLVIFPIYALALSVAGWAVFMFCSFLWIGFNQPIHTTIVQLCGAYTGAAAIGTLTDLIPIPVIPWLIDILALIILLSKLLDIESNDAILVAFFAWVAKVLLLMTVVAALMA